MSDQRLRELERRWKETGSPADEAAFLLERVRVGDLTRERLELAAYCGHEAALLCTSVTPPTDFTGWLVGLSRFSVPTLTLQRASAACALAVLATMTPADKRHPYWHLCETALADWATAPGPGTAERFDNVLAQANGAFLGDSEVCQLAFTAIGSVLLIPLHSIGTASAVTGVAQARHLTSCVVLEYAGLAANASRIIEPESR